MINALALAAVLLAGLYLAALGLTGLAKPAVASRFLRGFAGSAPLHYLELGVRVVVGLAFLRNAPAMWLPAAFSAFGWLLVVTSAALVLVPWQWHRRFAERSLPRALRYLPWIGMSSLLLGGWVLMAAWFGR